MGIGDRRDKPTGRIPTGELGKLTAQAAGDAGDADVVELEPGDRKTAEMNPGQFRELLAVGRAAPDESRARAKTVEDSETTAAMLASIGRPRRRFEAIEKPEAIAKGSSPDVPVVAMAPRPAAPASPFARDVETEQLYPMAPRTDAWLAIVVALVILGVAGAIVAVVFLQR